MQDGEYQEATGTAATVLAPLVAVVGIGASPRSLQSLAALFANIPHPSDAAFIVISQSADPVAIETLLAATRVTDDGFARVAVDRDRLEPNRCYVAPTGMMVTLQDGHLRLSEPEQAAGHRGTVDTFLISLAETQREVAVAILLADLNDAGSIGLARLKECGGFALAEAKTDAGGTAPEGPAGLADEIVPLDDIAERLALHLKHLREINEISETAALMKDGESRLPAVATILRNHTGHDFHGYKPNTFLRRIQRRMHVIRAADIDGYLGRLRDDPDEVHALFQDLLIGVTRFFRDPPEFEVLQSEIIPDLLGARAGESLRVWVLGCATGEEAYSIAILLREQMARMEAPPYVQIFATDIDSRALSIARTGRYPRSIARDVSAERLQRWFVKEGGTYCVHKDLREMCIFSAHNVVKDAPFSRIDLISCRNLLIYLKGELQDRLMPLFHFALRPPGYLFLGPAENVTRHAKLFEAIDRRHRIFRRLATATRVLPEFPLTASPERRRFANDALPVRRASTNSLTRRAELVVERHAPAYVIVDSNYDVLNFSGRTGRFLEPSGGAASLNLLNLVHRDLRLDLRSALHKASVERRPIRIAPLPMGDSAEARRIGLTIEPLADDTHDPPSFIVLFHDHGPDQGALTEETAGGTAVVRDEHVQQLEGELRITKDRLQTTIEQLESTNEELKSSNEEYQSINEELQSANEELETSKEELQSVNEELHTVNGELAHRVTELAQTNSDLKNLLESTRIATLFLDNDLRVKSFTPSMSEVFNLMDSDLGRPIAHLASRVAYPDLSSDVRKVLRTLGTVERQIGAPDGARYLVRVLPYRSVDNFIAGTVLTFLDVTETSQAQAALHVAEERLRMANAAARIVPWELDIASGKFQFVELFETAFGISAPSDLPALLAMLHSEDRVQVAGAFESAETDEQPLGIEGRLLLSGRELWVRISGRRSADESLRGVFEDVDERHRATRRQSLLMAELQHRVKNILAVVLSVTNRTLGAASDLDDFRARFVDRIEALARTQALLANRGIDGIELSELVRDEVLPKATTEDQVEVEGPRVQLKGKAAEVFSLAVHELATNAAKYGALAKPDGRLEVRWRILLAGGGSWLSLEWRESGVPLDGIPARNGFGRTLIERGLPYDLEALTALEFTRSGVRCTVQLPVGTRVIPLEESTDPDG
jgi:two-component system CheB/CheR fusion protein